MLTWARATATVILVAASLAGLAGCAGSSSSDATDRLTDPASSSSPTPTQSTPVDPSGDPSDTAEGCPYLTNDQVSAAVGMPTSETAGSVHACFFDPVGGVGPTVMVSRVDVQIAPVDYAAQTKALCLGEVTDLDLGDESFACVMGLGPQGQLYVGKVLITVNVEDAVDDDTGISMAAAMLREVTVPPTT
jgi:hypothetical protein